MKQLFIYGRERKKYIIILSIANQSRKNDFFHLRPSSWLIPTLWPIICAIVPASKCGSYTLISTLIPTAFGVHTVSGTETPASPPLNVSPLYSIFQIETTDQNKRNNLINLKTLAEQKKMPFTSRHLYKN